MSTPYDLIRQAFLKQHPGPMNWEELVGWHLADPFAYVIKEPDFFVMGRAVIKAASPDDIRDLRVRFPQEKCDAWFLYAFAGDMRKAFAILPRPLPWLGFERYDDPENELRFLPAAEIQRLSK